MNVGKRKGVKNPPTSKFKSYGCGKDESFQTYQSIDFFVRTGNGDVKFRTEGLAIEWACRINKAAGKVLATTVRKVTFKKWVNRNELVEDEVSEIERSKLLFETYLHFGYKTKGGLDV